MEEIVHPAGFIQFADLDITQSSSTAFTSFFEGISPTLVIVFPGVIGTDGLPEHILGVDGYNGEPLCFDPV